MLRNRNQTKVEFENEHFEKIKFVFCMSLFYFEALTITTFYIHGELIKY